MEGVGFNAETGGVVVVEGIYEGVAYEEGWLEDKFAIFEFEVVAGFVGYAGEEHGVVFGAVHIC